MSAFVFDSNAKGGMVGFIRHRELGPGNLL